MTAPSTDGASKRVYGVAALGLAGVALIALLISRSTAPAAAKPTFVPLDPAAYDDSASPVSVTVADPMVGKRDALVTLVVFASFQCPYTARAQPDLLSIRQAYGDSKLRLVWKTYIAPTHEKARGAGLAGIAVHALGGNDAFWKFHDTAFRNQAFLSGESYPAWGAEAGVDDRKVRLAVSDPSYAAKLAADDALARKLGVTRTPTYFANGTELEGPTTKEKLDALVKSEIENAEKLVASGLARDRVYVEASKKNTKLP